MTNVKLEDLSELILAPSTLLYGEKTPYTALADAGKIPLSLMDARYLQVAGDTMAGNLDMDDNSVLNIEQASFNLTPATTPTTGQFQWSEDEGTLIVGALDDTILRVGEVNIRAVQMTGATIPKGAAVIIIGASGQRPQIIPTNLAAGNPIDLSIGVTTENIDNNQQGYVTLIGFVRDMDTSAWAEGAVLWVDSVTPGNLTIVRPTAPLRPVLIGVVVVSNANNGIIFVDPINSLNLSLLADVHAPSPSDGDYLRWNAANSRWELSAT